MFRYGLRRQDQFNKGAAMLKDQRTITDPDGFFSFKIAGYPWRGKPVKSPLTERPIRGLVAIDEFGGFHAGVRTGVGGKHKGTEMAFLEDACSTKEKAIEESRKLVRDELTVDAQCLADKTTAKPGERIVKVEMDDGWKVEIFAPERPESISVENKTAPVATLKESRQSRFDALLSKLRIPSMKSDTSVPEKRSRSIDR